MFHTQDTQVDLNHERFYWKLNDYKSCIQTQKFLSFFVAFSVHKEIYGIY